MNLRSAGAGTDDVKPEEDDDSRRWRKRVKITHEKEIVEEDNIYQPHALAVIVPIFDNEQKTSELLALRFEFLAEIDVLCAGIEGASYGGVILMLCLPTCFLMTLISKLRAGPGFARVLVSWFSASVLFYFWSGILDLVIWRTREEHRVSVMAGGGMSAGINTEVREEIRNDPQSLSTSGDGEDLLIQKQQQWFPYEDSFKLNDETTLTSADVTRMLAPFLVDGRKQRIEEVVANRTYSVCPVVEGLLDLGNVSVVFRSADALGFRSVHVISNVSNRRYKKNRKVSAGAEKWLDVEMWENTGACIATLKARGYRIAVTHIAPDTVSIHDMDWRVPTAIFFGR
ncbi:hypothetical protein BDL97_06G138800 [Sphagnum fallax]|nr:hypothetical protein BDL97_06G138800 [Sphagnum fallax]